MNLNQTRFFDMLVEVVNRQSEQLQVMSRVMEDKVSKDKLINALELKANRKDVTTGFDKLRLYMDNFKNEDKIQYVTRHEIGEIINEHLLLDGNQNYNSSDHQQKLNMIAYEKLLERKLESRMTRDDAEVLFEKKILDYTKRDEIRGLKDYIETLSERVDNSEIEARVKLSEISEKLDDVSYDVRLKVENLQKEYSSAQFIRKRDLEFLDKECFFDLKADVENLKKAQIAENFDLILKKTRKLDDSIKKLDKDFDYALGKFKTDNEKIINELKFDVITYKSDVLSEFSKVHKTIGSGQPVQEESNFDIKLDKIYKQIGLFENSVKAIEQEMSEKVREMNKTTEECRNNTEKLKKINTHVQLELADLKKVVTGKQNQRQDLSTLFDDMKHEHNRKLSEIEIEIKALKINAKERISSHKQNNTVDDFETYVLERLSKLDKALKGIDQSGSDRKMISTVKILPEKESTNEYANELKQLRTMIDKKADSFTICKLLDEKADIEEVNKLLKELHNEIDSIPAQIVEPTRTIDTIRKSEAVMWTWKSGLLISDQRIPWENEQHNTMPSNFILCKNRFETIVMSEGLYEISFGFFGRKKPKVEMILNGEVIVNSLKMKLSENSDKFENKHSSGNIVGLTYYDFIALPYNSRIYFTFEGGKGYEGFVRFKKFK